MGESKRKPTNLDEHLLFSTQANAGANGRKLPGISYKVNIMIKMKRCFFCFSFLFFFVSRFSFQLTCLCLAAQPAFTISSSSDQRRISSSSYLLFQNSFFCSIADNFIHLRSGLITYFFQEDRIFFPKFSLYLI